MEKQQRVLLARGPLMVLGKNAIMLALSFVMSFALISGLFKVDNARLYDLGFLWGEKDVLSDDSYLDYAFLSRKKDYYDFHPVEKSFGRIDVSRITELSKEEFEALILISVPENLRGKLELYLKTALNNAEKFEVDPFWVLAVMWTESHFNQRARSHVNARGLMQIMPKTGHFLAGLLNRPVKSVRKAVQLTRNPSVNIEMGAFYLKKILTDFRSNYRFATAAYNMGPGAVRKRLRRGAPVGVRNKYLDKVRKAYKNLIQGYRKKVLALPIDYANTYVIKNKRFNTALSLFWVYDEFWATQEMPYRKALKLVSFDYILRDMKNTYIL
ncbi:lytic transglycosylase domain-containing protein [Bacteriovoracales bacterium]|nr:lytic transglycosylase domain-containing protein [Bacteriovoracales bacterium]